MKREIPKWFTSYIPEEVSDSTLFKFTIKLPGGNPIEVDMRADLGIDYSIIQSQLEDTPSEFAYWSAIYSELKLQCGILERKIKARRGKVGDTMIREALKAQVRLTDKQIQAVVDCDVEMNKLEVEHLLLQKHTGKMYFMVEAIKMKSDNLRSLAGFARIEYGQTK